MQLFHTNILNLLRCFKGSISPLYLMNVNRKYPSRNGVMYTSSGCEFRGVDVGATEAAKAS